MYQERIAHQSRRILTGRMGLFGALAITLLCANLPVEGQTPEQLLRKLESDRRLVSGTDLYRDCEAANRGGREAQALLASSWRRSFEALKAWLKADDAGETKFSLTLEPMLTNGLFKPEVNSEQVLQRLNKLTLRMNDTHGFVYSSGEAREIVIDEDLVCKLCERLTPTDSFEGLNESAARVVTLPTEQQRAAARSLLAERSSALTATFLVRSARYAGVKLFVVGHETSHAILDPFSKDLLEEKGYNREPVHIVTMIWTETRADLLGVRALTYMPTIEKLDPVIRAHATEFSQADLDGMAKIALLYGADDVLSILAAEETGVPFSVGQRRDAMMTALRHREQQKNPK